MPSSNRVGIAPLATGLLLVGQSLRPLVQGDPTPWAAAGLVGGGAAVCVGVGILSGWGVFDADSGGPGRPVTAALTALTALAFGVGVLLVVV